MTKVYAKFSPDGRIEGFWQEDVHGASVPFDAVEITPEQWAAIAGAPDCWRWENGGLVELPMPAPEPEPLPALTPRQLRLMLLQLDMSDQDVETAIAAIPDPDERATALIEWQWASIYERDHPLVAQLAVALEFEAGELDALWEYAADL